MHEAVLAAISVVLTASWCMMFDIVIEHRPESISPRLWAVICLVVMFGIPLTLMVRAL
jgi:hypothetical protein